MSLHPHHHVSCRQAYTLTGRRGATTDNEPSSLRFLQCARSHFRTLGIPQVQCLPGGRTTNVSPQRPPRAASASCTLPGNSPVNRRLESYICTRDVPLRLLRRKTHQLGRANRSPSCSLPQRQNDVGLARRSWLRAGDIQSGEERLSTLPHCSAV